MKNKLLKGLVISIISISVISLTGIISTKKINTTSKEKKEIYMYDNDNVIEKLRAVNKYKNKDTIINYNKLNTMLINNNKYNLSNKELNNSLLDINRYNYMFKWFFGGW